MSNRNCGTCECAIIKQEFGSTAIRCGRQNRRLQMLIKAGMLTETKGRVTHMIPKGVDARKIDTPAPAWCPCR